MRAGMSGQTPRLPRPGNVLRVGLVAALALWAASCDSDGSGSGDGLALVPRHVLTEASANFPVHAAAGDRIEIRLKETGTVPTRWVRIDAAAQEMTGPPDGEEMLQDGERLRVFRLKAEKGEPAELMFALMESETGMIRSAPLTYIIKVE